ncbi:MAG: exodeoxyribonuclease III, partial [Planctomycetota bacterium]
MRIMTWNVNSVKVRAERLAGVLERHEPDVLCLQELKTPELPEAVLTDLEHRGYHAAVHGQKTYNGVAILSRSPIEDVTVGIPGTHHPEARVISGIVDGVMLLNLYVVNGKEVGSDKYDYKLGWMGDVAGYVAERFP